MPKTKQYTTPEQQIAKLKSQNLAFGDEKRAELSLSLFGYFNLIKGYRDPYVINNGSGISYRSGMTFEQICSLYLLDKNLRNAVIAAMLDLEEYVKEAVSDVLACSFGTDHRNYLRYSNFRNKKKRHPKFSLTHTLKRINDTLSRENDPIKHYLDTYGSVPPWVLIKVQFLGNVVNLVDQMKEPQQIMLFQRLYPADLGPVTKEHLSLMMDTLFICYEYRNVAAHGGRIYNHTCRAKYRPVSWARISSSGFSQLLQLLSLMEYQGPYRHLDRVLNHEFTRYFNEYPEDITYLSSILNIDIRVQEFVWISGKSKRFHSAQHCSGMSNAFRIDYAKAIESGYVPCKRCCKNADLN